MDRGDDIATVRVRASGTERTLAPSPMRLAAYGLVLLALAGFAYERNVAALFAAVTLTAVVVLSARRSSTVRAIATLLMFALGVHLVGVVAIREVSLALGMNGFVTGDDAAYADVAAKLALSWQGVSQPSLAGGQAYLLGAFVYLEAAIFFVVGPNATVAQIVNVAFALALVVVSYELTRRLTNERAAVAAAAIVALYPSLVVWSSLNLKDALVWLTAALILLTIVRFSGEPRLGDFIAAPMLLIPMISLRRYLFLELVVIFVVGVLLADYPRRSGRLVWSGAAIASAVALLGVSQVWGASVLPGEPLAALEETRYNMGVGARTSFQDIFPADVNGTYVVVTLPGNASPSPAPTPSPNVIYVRPGAQIALAPSSVTPEQNTGTVYLRPGDIVVVGDPTVTPGPEDARAILALSDPGRPVTIVAKGSFEALLRTLAYLPRGLAYALFAPFPWSLGRTADLLPIPEMLFWYVLLVSAAAGLMGLVPQWRKVLPLVLYFGATVVALALIEGNVGTLFRHRAMIIPFVVVLASPTLVSGFRLLQESLLSVRRTRSTTP